ncbi:MAG: type II secretion system protein [Candidatus Saccharibacteria bacterium]|nr:type II secretion system protein [Candidatus Saccharibacteria bacterium]
MKKGFTTIEIIVAIVFLTTLFVLFVNQSNQVNQKLRDQERKASINAIYFNLTQVYFKQNGYYPEILTPEIISGVDPAIFSDPNKILLGDKGCDYEYKTSDCQNNQCKQFSISSKMELEDNYSKSSK